ncbi:MULTISPECIES: hypothetical protein [unclassified Photorhabdus]|uniref:hypothetical protein n=1 Tax=unclassified Photorhabdus TaxID=2620880 RepID=UPI000DCB9BD2|nr:MULTISPECIES: hypothetical protein [unclassified Photorhabdus]RAX04313.1 hypothetical protein CKY03_00705 [Photorhabdus sp. S9-53]RAX04644.1 hypothetical protein CKY05_00705 [Photorhabdus sp. S10-54]RAX06262.1 hypothetical protein CKY04_00705 [Photorhabdus sp. S8-52]
MKRNIQPGFCVVQQPGGLSFQASLLFSHSNSEAARYFMALNSNYRSLKPGQILLVADPDSYNPPHIIQLLKQSQYDVNQSISTLPNEYAAFLHRHFGLFHYVLDQRGTLVGTASSMGDTYFSQIKKNLKNLQELYQKEYRLNGLNRKYASPEFYVERQLIMGNLKRLLNKVGRLSLKIDQHPNLKHALKLSTKAIAHQWDKVGVGAIKGYSHIVTRSAKMVKWMKYGGRIAIGLDFIDTTGQVIDACNYGQTGKCEKVAIKEYSKFVGRTGGGMGIGYYSGLAAGTACIALGAATDGLTAGLCMAGGGLAGGYAGSKGGEWFLELIVEYSMGF